MAKQERLPVSEQSAPSPVTIDPEVCNGCNICVEICQSDLFLPNPQKGKPPIVAYPSECWYDGSCVACCPKKGAIRLNQLPQNKVHWKPR